MSLSFTVAAIVFLITAVGVVAVAPLMLSYLGLENVTQWLFTLARWPLLLLAIAIALAMIYRYGPSRAEPKWRWITWGSAFAAVSWIVLSLLFSWYAANFSTYNATYGSLGAVIAFMTWMWLSASVVLVGAAIDAETEPQAVSGRGKNIGEVTVAADERLIGGVTEHAVAAGQVEKAAVQGPSGIAGAQENSPVGTRAADSFANKSGADQLTSNSQREGEQSSEEAKAAKAVLDTQQKAVDDIRAGRPAPYYFTAPQSSVSSGETAPSGANNLDAQKKRLPRRHRT
jgi:hypothetical protein